MRENRSCFATLIIVVLAALVAALLLVAAFVVWLAGLMGSLLYPCLIVGIALAIFALILYKVSLCRKVCRAYFPIESNGILP